MTEKRCFVVFYFGGGGVCNVCGWIDFVNVCVVVVVGEGDLVFVLFFGGGGWIGG